MSDSEVKKEEVIVCIDIGGSHIAFGTLKEINGSLQPLQNSRGDVNSAADQSSILAEWDAVLRQSYDPNTQEISKMFVSIPGPFDYDKGICLMDGMHKYQSLLHMDVRAHFAETYGVPPQEISFFNDAQAFLLGEVYHHHLHGHRVVGLTLGTGLGSAFYTMTGVDDLNYGSSPFREGISEDYISTRGVLRFLQEQGVEGVPHVKALFDNAALDDARVAAFSFLSDALLDFIKLHILPLEPQCIVLGGNIAKAHAEFLPQIEGELAIPFYIASFDEWNLFYGLATSSVSI